MNEIKLRLRRLPLSAALAITAAYSLSERNSLMEAKG